MIILIGNIDYIITLAPVKGWDILNSKWTVSSWISCVGSRKNGKWKDLSDSDKGQIVIARQLGQSISTILVGCSHNAVVNTYQKWCKEGQLVSWHQGHGCPRLNDACGERRLACLVQSHRRATLAQIAGQRNAGHDRKVSENITVCCVWSYITTDWSESLWCPLSTTKSARTVPWSNRSRLPGLMNHIFL